MSCKLRSILPLLLPLTLLVCALGFSQASANGLPVIDAEAWAQDSVLELPLRRTSLGVTAHQADPNPNPLTYRWVQISGPPAGKVRFSPNGDGSSDSTTATFQQNVAGTYRLRVIVSNGLRESISEVEVTLEPGRSGDLSSDPRFRSERRAGRIVHTRIDRVIVRFESPADPRNGLAPLSSASQAEMDALGATLTKTWLRGRLGLVELATEVQDPAGLDMLLEALQALPEIRYAEPDDAIELDYMPNDPLFDAQWGLENSSGVDIGATRAWDQTTGSATTLVAVMDTGVDYTHPDLYLSIAINNGEIPAALLAQLVDTSGNGLIDFYDLNSLDANGDLVLDGLGEMYNQGFAADLNGNGYIDADDLRVPAWLDGIDDDSNGYLDDLTGWDSLTGTNDPMDVHGHGTHVTGILAARGDNAAGIAGVDWRAQILPERFHNAAGSSVADAIQAIEHAVLLGADVINASWGTFSNNAALKEAIEWAGNNGAVVVAAAGNHSSDIDDPSNAYYPAAYDNVPNLIAVASVDPDGSLSSFSNFGQNSVDIAAPGASIRSTGLGGNYVLWSGTSMATPHVAGTVSLLAGLFPGESPDWLVNRVLSTAAPISSLAGATQTGGMVDAFAAVNTQNLAGPRVLSADPIGDVVGPVGQVLLTFDSAMSASTFTTGDVQLDGPFGAIVPTAVNRISDFVFEIVFQPQAASGTYSLVAGPDVEDSLGRLMDQDRDGAAGESIDDRFGLVFRVLPPPSSRTLDDGSAGYSTSGGWNTYTGAGAQGDFSYKSVGSGAGTATWTLSGLTAGDYLVSVTWQAYSNRASDAPYTVLDGTTALGTVTMDQRVAPNDFVEDGVAWQDVGVYQVTGDTLVVRLTDQSGPSGSYVIADAVRIERVGDAIPAPEVQVQVSGVDVPDGSGSVDFGTTVVGTPMTQTITVGNVGTLDLSLGSITLPSGYGLVSGFGATLLAPGQTTDFVVELEAAAEGSYNGTISFDSNDGDENPFDFSVSGSVVPWTPPAPEVEVLVGGTDVPDGSGSVDFGTTVVGAPVRQTITVGNVGTLDLSLGLITLPSGYSPVSGFGTTLLVPGQTTNFVVELDAASAGTHVGVISFDSNDADENPFDFNVTGTVSAAPLPTWTLDDGSAGYSTSGGWITYTGAGAQGDFSYKSVGSGAGTATWTLSGLTAGDYLVSVTWQAYSNRTSDAPYTVLDGTTALGTVTMDQRVAPVGFVEDGVAWQDVGVYQVTGGTLVVRLTDQSGPSGSYVIADAVRIERVGEAIPAPEVQVQVSGVDVPDGSGSVDFGTTVVGAPVRQTITVGNVGTLDLSLGSITLPSGYGLVSGFGATLLAPGQTTDFVVELEAAAEGSYNGTISFDSNDADENPFDFSVSGSVVPWTPPAPEVEVLVGGTDVADGSGSVDFGTTVVGAPVRQTITVGNVGTLDLSLGLITLPSGYSLVSGFGTTLLVPGQTTDFVVELEAVVEGTHVGVISFDSNDADENPFDFNVSGTVSAASLPTWTLDDGSAGYSTTGVWNTYTGVGADGDFSYKAVGSGAGTATWTLSGLSAGNYLVSVTWQAYSNRASDAPYTVLDGTTELGTVTMDQRVAPVGFVEDGVAWQDVGVYQVTGGALVVRLTDQSGPSGSYVIADAVRIERVGDAIPAPEVQVQVGGVDVPDGSGSVDFGTTVVGAPVTQTITVGNVGTLDLSLGLITLPSGYGLVSGFGATLLVQGQTTDFVVELEAVVEGTHVGVISFDSNDADENPFDFNVSGTVSAASLPTWTLDDGSAGYSTTGVWNTYTGVGADGDFSYKAVGSGAGTATWTLSGLSAGNYLVSVTWQAYSNRASAAPYTVLDGSTELGTVTMDQRVAPVGFVEGGVAWQDVGVYQVTGDTLVVRLTDQSGPSGSYVIADAVRIERIGD